MSNVYKDWPGPRVIIAALRGSLLPVNILLSGARFDGLVNADLVFDGAKLLCLTCGTLEDVCDMPVSRGLDGRPQPLFSPVSDAGGLYVRAWLGEMTRAHEDAHRDRMPEGWES